MQVNKKRVLPLIISQIILLIFLSVLVTPLQINYNVYADTKTDCTTWKLTSTDEWIDGVDYIKTLNPLGYEKVTGENKSIKFNTNFSSNISNPSELGIASSTNSMRDTGSQIYSLMKLIILTGLDVEFNGSKGLNPNIFYWDLALATGQNSFDYTTVYSYNDSQNFYAKYLQARYKDLTMSQHKEFGTSASYTAEAKANEIKEVLDKKQYVIVKLKDSKYVLLTGYRHEDSTTTFLMEDNYSSEELFTKLYKIEDITDFYAFTLTGNYQSRLDFYNSGSEIPWNLRLINKTHEISKDEISSIETKVASVALASISKASGNSYERNEMDSRVIEFLDTMVTAYQNETGKILKCQSGMRSYAYQEQLFNGYGGASSQAETYSAHPGKSEHNAGLAMDFNSEGHGAESSFGTTPGFNWLKKRAFAFGFIWRYPDIDDCVNKTGYITEEWHWRYIGTEWAEKYIEFIGGEIETDSNGNKYTDVFDNGDYNGKVYEEFYEEVVVPYFATKQNSSNENLADTTNTNKPLTIGSCDNEYIDAPIKRMEYFFRHPVIALSNMIVSICQTVHNSIGTGSIGDIFGTTFLIKNVTTNYIMKFYIIFATIVFFISAVYKGYLYIWGKVRTIRDLIWEIYSILRATSLPLICILALSYGLNYVNEKFLGDLYGDLIAIETQGITKITETDSNSTSETLSTVATVDENGNVNLKPVEEEVTIGSSNTYYMTEDWLENNLFIEVLDEDAYNNINIKMPKSYSKDRMEYYNIDLETLYSTIEATKTIDNLNDTNYQYYNCNEFVPVHKDNYSTSVFYYFYDYIKYQYLSYWSSNSKKSWASDYVFSGEEFNLQPLAEFYSLTADDDLTEKISELKTTEDLTGYKNRMKYLENTFFKTSVNGFKEMYRNTKYSYTDNYKNNLKISDERYVNDLTGLSLMFNMNNCIVDYSDCTYMNEWINKYKEYKEMTQPITFEDWRNGAKQEVREFNCNNNPIVFLADSDFWGYYTAKTKLSSMMNENDKLSAYRFYPEEIDSKFNKYDNLRVSGRVYASYGRLIYDTFESSDYKVISKPTVLEQKLIKVNENNYDDFMKFLNKAPSDINDDTACLVLAIIATINFNQEFGGVYPKDIDTEYIDIDKIFRLTYIDSINDITKNNEQIFFMIYNKSNAINILVLTSIEILMVIYNVSRIILIICIIINSLWLALSYCFHKPDGVETSLKGIILQILMLFLTDILAIGILRINIILNNGSTSEWIQVALALLLFLLFFFLTTVTVIFTVAMLKDFRNYGYTILNGIVQNTKNVYNRVLADLEQNPNLKIDDKIKKNKSINNKKLAVRKYNLRIFDDDSDND